MTAHVDNRKSNETQRLMAKRTGRKNASVLKVRRKKIVGAVFPEEIDQMLENVGRKE